MTLLVVGRSGQVARALPRGARGLPDGLVEEIRTLYGFDKLCPAIGELPIEIPRDRHGTFEPQIVEKHQTRWVGSTTRFFRCTHGA